MLKQTDHCMPVVTPSKPSAFKRAKIFPTVDRCDHVQGLGADDYESKGFNFYRDIETKECKYTIPKKINGRAKFSSKVRSKPFENRLTEDEIDLIIRDKFLNDRFWIQELFKTSDVHKHGFITKDTLMKIIFSMCEYLTIDQFYKLLERYKLNAKPVITFAEMERAFGPPKTSKFPPPVIFHGMGNKYNVSAAFALHLLKEAALDQDFDLKEILPKSCFEPDGIVLSPQFRDALKRIKITLCDEDFTRLWIKIDAEGVGSIPLNTLLSMLNLQDNGKPMCGIRPTFIPLKRPKIKQIIRPKPPLKYTNCYELNKELVEPNIKAGDVSFPLIKVHGWKPKGPGGLDEYAFGKGTHFLDGLNLLRNNRPDFNNVFDKLSYIFEEPYQSMLIVFKHFDSKNSGLVPLDTGLNILCEYGFNLEIDNLVKFLSKTYCLNTNSGMHYRKLLDNVQTKGAFTYVNKMISQIITAENQSSGLKSLRTMSVEEVEKEFYKILHKDFINFKSQLEKASQSPNYILESDAKRIIENIIGNTMSKEQWTNLQSYFDYDKSAGDDEDENPNRMIDFRKFLEKFNKPTGICRYRFSPELNKCLNWSKKKKVVNSELYDPPRCYSLLCRMVADVLKRRFHAMDKIYKSFETKHQVTLTKEILHELLNSQNCKLNNKDMDIIWEVVESQPHYSSLSYRQALKYLMLNLFKKSQEICVNKRLLNKENPHIKVLQEFRKNSKEEKAKLVATDNKTIDIAMKAKSYKVDSEKVKQTIEKISPMMKANWKSFKKQIRQIDIVGNTTIELFEMKNLMVKNDFLLSEEEMDNLLYAFDLKKSGKFWYIPFLNEFATSDPDDTEVKPDLHFDRVRHQLLNQLIKKWKSLIRAFRKIDVNKTGKLDMDQLNKIILDAGICLSEDDLYHVFSGFDTNLDGKIDYVEFVEQLLDVFNPNPH